MPYRRTGLRKQGILSALELRGCNDGEYVRTAGCVIARQRPGTAKGFIFLSMEDESGIANVIVTPDLYERERLLVSRSKFLNRRQDALPCSFAGVPDEAAPEIAEGDTDLSIDPEAIEEEAAV